MPDSNREVAERLLDAQVQFIQDQLGPEQLAPLLEAEIDHALTVAGQLMLGQVVTREQITDVALKYASKTQLPGSIPELATEIAKRLYTHPTQESTRLDEVVAAKHVEALTTKLLELPLVQERLMESPLVVEIVAELLYRLATEAAAQNRELATRIPGVSSLLGAGGQLLGRAAPDAAVDFDARMRELSEQTARLLLRRARGTVNRPQEPWIRDTVLERWREQADQPVGAFREYFTQEDLEDLLILAYDFWLGFRETAYLRALIAEGVDFFFDAYGDSTLLALLEEFGVTRADLVEEAHRFAPPVIAVLREQGILEAFLRRRLEPFFLSEQALGLLG